MQNIQISRQEFISESETILLPTPRYAGSADVLISSLRSYEAAAQGAWSDHRTCILNFASWANPGGGDRGIISNEDLLNLHIQRGRRILPDYLHHFRTIEFAIFCRPNDTTNYQVFNQILTNI